MIHSFLHSLYPEFIKILKTNEFAAGGFLTGSLLAIWGIAKGLPSKMWEGFLYFFSTTLTLDSDSAAFNHYSLWIASKGYLEKSRRLYITMGRTNIYVDADEMPTPQGANISNSNKPEINSYRVQFGDGANNSQELTVTPNAGNHFFIFRRTPVWLTYNRSEAKSIGRQYIHSATIRLFTRNKDRAHELLSEMLSIAAKSLENNVEVYTAGKYNGWDLADKRPNRELTTIVLPAGLKQEIVADLEFFTSSKGWYNNKGIPHRRGYLLYGPPGNGKSSLAHSIATTLNAKLYVMSLSSLTSDKELWLLCSDLSNGSVMLIEDIDCLGMNRETDASKTSGVTLAGVLNILDGLNSKDGCLYILSTNYPERLDKALIRPGRMDLKIELTNATPTMAAEMYSNLTDKVAPKELLQWIERHDVSMAIVQEAIVRHFHKNFDIIKSLDETYSQELDIPKKLEQSIETNQAPEPNKGHHPLAGHVGLQDDD